ncbi:MAG: SMP-30/gluconolactonase/LRE family protein [Pseudomonadaceae bacterium]|nr:SMP-30/gluconolactonase/LRE family protein [Pseudomonadaceae bacterium]
MTTLTTLIEHLHFPEGPRWREGELFFSDMHAGRVVASTPDGSTRTVVETGDDPSGLGWLPAGEMLIVAMNRRAVLKFDGRKLTVHADLSELASGICNDMVVDSQGQAYVGNFGFDLHNGAEPSTAELICIDPDGSNPRIVADELMFPNGCVITPDGSTLVVAESFAGRLTAFDRDANGDLNNRRLWASLPDGAVPDGICLDSAGGIWVASPSSSEVLRVLEGGEITDRHDTGRGAYACALGERTLYVLTASGSQPQFCRDNATACVETVQVDFPGAGYP